MAAVEEEKTMAAVDEGKTKKVTSLRDLQALVKVMGQEEGVDVKVGPTLAKLCDATPMRKRLRELSKSKGWRVSNIDKLEPFAEASTKVQQANQAVCKLLEIFNPNQYVVIVTNFSVDVPKRERFLRRQVKTLEKLGEDLEATEMEPTKKIGRSLLAIAKEVRANENELCTTLNSHLIELRKSCSKVYNQAFEIGV